jgi:hypothetical protein
LPDTVAALVVRAVGVPYDVIVSPFATPGETMDLERVIVVPAMFVIIVPAGMGLVPPIYAVISETSIPTESPAALATETVVAPIDALAVVVVSMF